MNSLEAIRELMIVERTPQDKGWESIIKVAQYDNGIVTINGSPIGQKFTEAKRRVAAMRIVAQILEEFFDQCDRSMMTTDGEPTGATHL